MMIFQHRLGNISSETAISSESTCAFCKQRSFQMIHGLQKVLQYYVLLTTMLQLLGFSQKTLPRAGKK